MLPTRFCCSIPRAPHPSPRAFRSPTTASSETPVSLYAQHGITAADRILSAAPFGHLYGLYAFHLALAAGACTVLLPTFTPPDLTRVLGAESVTVLFAGPAHVAACLGAGLLDAGEVASLRLAVMAGSPLPPAVAKGLQERIGNGHVTQLWGMTELQADLYTRPG